MGGLVVEVKGSCKRIHVKREARTWGNRQKEAHSRGNMEDKVSEDEHHGGGSWANMEVSEQLRTWLLMQDPSGRAVAPNMTQKAAVMAAPVNMVGVSGSVVLVIHLHLWAASQYGFSLK